MANSENFIEYGSDEGVEKRDYPGELSESQASRHHQLTKTSQVVSVYFLQHDHSWTLQLQCTGYLGSHE